MAPSLLCIATRTACSRIVFPYYLVIGSVWMVIGYSIESTLPLPINNPTVTRPKSCCNIRILTPWLPQIYSVCSFCFRNKDYGYVPYKYARKRIFWWVHLLFNKSHHLQYKMILSENDRGWLGLMRSRRRRWRENGDSYYARFTTHWDHYHVLLYSDPKPCPSAELDLLE